MNLCSSITCRVPAALLGMLLLGACATPRDDVQLMALPSVAAGSAATITVRSQDNNSPVQHYHLLRLDGKAILKFAESERKQFELAPGSHDLQLTCHSRYTLNGNNLPVNYRVADGESTLNINVEAGDSLCLKISFNPLNCAILRESGPSWCE